MFEKNIARYPQTTTIHVTLPAAASQLLLGLPTRTIGWDEKEIDAELDIEIWQAIAPGRREELMRRGRTSSLNFKFYQN